MLCIDDIVCDYDKLERKILKSDKTINDWFDQFDGYNWEHTEDYTKFDFEDDDYVFTIIQYADGKPRLSNEFSIYARTGLINFERS